MQEDKLHTLVYGESMLNVPVAILAYELFLQTQYNDLLSVSISTDSLEGLRPRGPIFDMIMKGSIGIGIGIGSSWASALLFRVSGVQSAPTHLIKTISEGELARAQKAGTSNLKSGVVRTNVLRINNVPDELAHHPDKLEALCEFHGAVRLIVCCAMSRSSQHTARSHLHKLYNRATLTITLALMARRPAGGGHDCAVRGWRLLVPLGFQIGNTESYSCSRSLQVWCCY